MGDEGGDKWIIQWMSYNGKGQWSRGRRHCGGGLGEAVEGQVHCGW